MYYWFLYKKEVNVNKLRKQRNSCINFGITLLLNAFVKKVRMSKTCAIFPRGVIKVFDHCISHMFIRYLVVDR